MCVGENQHLPSQDSMNCDVEENVADQEAGVNENMRNCTASRILTVVFNFISRTVPRQQ